MKENEEDLNEVEKINDNVEMVELTEEEENDLTGGKKKAIDSISFVRGFINPGVKYYEFSLEDTAYPIEIISENISSTQNVGVIPYSRENKIRIALSDNVTQQVYGDIVYKDRRGGRKTARVMLIVKR